MVAQTEVKAIRHSASGAAEALQIERQRSERAEGQLKQVATQLRQVYTPDPQRRISGQHTISCVTLRADAPKLTPLDQLTSMVNSEGGLVKVYYSLPPTREENQSWDYLPEGGDVEQQLVRMHGEDWAATWLGPQSSEFSIEESCSNHSISTDVSRMRTDSPSCTNASRSIRPSRSTSTALALVGRQVAVRVRHRRIGVDRGARATRGPVRSPD